MKQVFTFAAFLSILFQGVNAQENPFNIPESFSRNLPSPKEEVVLKAPDTKSLAEEDEQREKQGVLYRAGVIMPVETVTKESGTWDYAGGKAIWRFKFKTSGAKGLNVYFDDFNLPEDGAFFVYNADRSHVVGPYTKANSTDGDVFATAPVLGNELILEYNGSKETADDFVFATSEIGYMYRGSFGPKNASDFMSSDNCEVNANCSEGASWDAQRRAAVKIIVRDGNAAGLCSGALINSANNDCTPYVLTANHCGGGATLSNYKQWVFYFNFETPGCTNPTSAANLDDQTITGCLKMANSSDVSDVIASDFLLVHLKSRPASSFNAYMAGWSRSTSASTSGVSIHHPSGDVKKISTYTATLTNSGWSGGNWGKHWGVVWAGTANGHGVTEGGSSGSPIFNSAGQILGQLSGGSSFCSNTSGQDVYGKFSYNWDQTATTENRRLKAWLDKGNANPTTLTGKEVNSCAAMSAPVVDFVADNTTPSIGQTVTFSNLTPGTADGFLWSISPSTHTYVDGTNDKSENPKVIFNSTSSYTVILHVYNAGGYGIKTRTGYIKPHNTASVTESALASKPLLFPNPSSDGRFTVLSQNQNPIVRVRIADITGKVIFDAGQNETTLYESNGLSFSDGVYLIETETREGRFYHKWIVE
jgi:hypothetical protein